MKELSKEQNSQALIAACQPDDPLKLSFRKTPKIKSLDEVKRLVQLKPVKKIDLDYVDKVSMISYFP